MSTPSAPEPSLDHLPQEAPATPLPEPTPEEVEAQQQRWAGRRPQGRPLAAILPTPGAAILAALPEPTCEVCFDEGYSNFPAVGDICHCAAGAAIRHERALEEAATRARIRAAFFVTAGVPAEFAGLTVDGLAALDDPHKADAIEAVRAYLARRAQTPSAPIRVKTLAELMGADPVGRQGIILHGPCSVGKTGLLSAVYQVLVERGTNGLWIETGEFFEAVQDGYNDGTSAARLRAAREAPLLLLDELGTTRLLIRGAGPSETWRSQPETADKQRLLDTLVSYRHRHQLPTLITTNLGLDQIADQFGDRVVERLIQMCESVHMGGRNLRLGA